MAAGIGVDIAAGAEEKQRHGSELAFLDLPVGRTHPVGRHHFVERQIHRDAVDAVAVQQQFAGAVRTHETDPADGLVRGVFLRFHAVFAQFSGERRPPGFGKGDFFRIAERFGRGLQDRFLPDFLKTRIGFSGSDAAGDAQCRTAVRMGRREGDAFRRDMVFLRDRRPHFGAIQPVHRAQVGGYDHGAVLSVVEKYGPAVKRIVHPEIPAPLKRTVAVKFGEERNFQDRFRTSNFKHLVFLLFRHDRLSVPYYNLSA